MGTVEFPRDAQGRIITDPSAVSSAPEVAPPAASRPPRALDPSAHESMKLPGVTAADKPSTPPLTRGQLAAALVTAALLALALIALVARATPAPAAGPLAQPTAAQPTTAPTASLAPTPFGMPVGRAIVAYFDYQRLDTATALENGTRVQPVARIGEQWVLLALADGGEVWVRWGDLPAPTLADLPERAPAPTSAPPPTAPPPSAPQPAPATGAPATCDEASALYRVAQEVPPYGRVLGYSCVSLDEAASNADAAAAELRATSEARP